MVNIIDDFEDQDLGEYSGKKQASNGYEITSTRAFNKTYSVEYDNDNSDSVFGIYSTSGLDNYPQNNGEDFVCRIYVESGTPRQVAIGFAQQDNPTDPTSDHYSVDIDFVDGVWRIQKRNGNSTLAEDTNVSPPTGEWLEYRVNWDSNGNIVATLKNASGTQLSQISATDTTWSSGGIALWNNHGSGGTNIAQYDYITQDVSIGSVRETVSGVIQTESGVLKTEP